MKKLPLTGKYGEGRFLLIDDEDAILIADFRWCLMTNGYVGAKSGCIYVHRLITGAKKGQIVDHKNGDKLDNRRANLRFASFADNVRNMRKQPNKSSIYKGVSWLKANRKWEANIHVNDKKKRLGLHLSEVAAAQAYNRAAQQLFGEFALLNKI